MSKYLDRLNEKDEAKNAKANELAAAHAYESVKQKISQLKVTGKTLEAAYEASLGAKPFNVDKVFSLTEELEANSKKIAIAEKVLSTEFATE